MEHVNFSITHIGTATAILNINGVKILTDPAFPDADWKAPGGATSILKNPKLGASGLDDLPHIDGILLSHEDHLDNLDERGRTLLTARKVLTTTGSKINLDANPDIYGMKDWENRETVFGEQKFVSTATPCKHYPGGECIGFLIQTEAFGMSSKGLSNAIYYSGDTVYIEELKEIAKCVHVTAALLNLGSAHVPMENGTTQLQIMMDGKQAAQLFKNIGADLLIPMHFASWSHFAENKDDVVKAFDDAGVGEKVRWLTPGQEQKIY